MVYNKGARSIQKERMIIIETQSNKGERLMKTMDVSRLSETFNTAYYERDDKEMVIVLWQVVEQDEDNYLSVGTVEEMFQELPSTRESEFYRLKFTSQLKEGMEEWAQEFPLEAEDFNYEVMHKFLPPTKENFKNLSDEQLFTLIVDFVAEVASVDWEPIT